MPRSTSRRFGLPPVLLAIGLLAAPIGCGGSVPESTVAAAPALEIRRPRAHLMPGMGVVYLSIVNNSDLGDRLVAIETAAARAAETHETVDDDGVMRMVAHPDGFEIPPRGTLELSPGGKHIMLVEPLEPAGGEATGAAATIRLTLRFERAGPLDVDVPLAAMGEVAMREMDH